MKLTGVLANLERLKRGGADFGSSPGLVAAIAFPGQVTPEQREALEALLLQRADMIEALEEARVLLHRAAFMQGCICHVIEPDPFRPPIDGKCLPCAAREAIGTWRPGRIS